MRKTKKSRTRGDLAQVAPDRGERISSLRKAVFELLEDNTNTTAKLPVHSSHEEISAHAEIPFLAVPITSGEASNNRHRDAAHSSLDEYTSFVPHIPGNEFSGAAAVRAEEPRMDSQFGPHTDSLTQTSHLHIGEDPFSELFADLDNLGYGNTGSWDHVDNFDPVLWSGVVLNNLESQITFPENVVHNASEHVTSTSVVEGEDYFNNYTGTSQNDTPPLSRPGRSCGCGSAGSMSNNNGFTSSEDLSNSDESEQMLEGSKWVKIPQAQTSGSGSGSQLASSANSANSDWSLIEMAREKDASENLSGTGNSSSQPLRWSSKELGLKESPSKRRGPFQNKQLQEETSETRRRGACVRCRMQKIRCLANNNDPNGDCMTCQAVSTQIIHKMPCRRYKISECTLFRIGKAPGMEFTFRWPVMKLKDISNWANAEIRTISILSDVCPVPLDFHVRKFVPIPQDTLFRAWMDGKVKKWKEVTPFAIVNMSNAVKDMRTYIDTYVFKCMEFCLEGQDALVRETYVFARKYMLTAPEEEARLLGDFFRLWFAIRRTATVEYISGEDTLDMVPENDPSYHLNGKIPLPPVMVQQLDMILTLGLLQPLRKKALENFHKIIVANKPKSWMTVYLITFMFLHSCSSLTSKNYNGARKHGLKRRYGMPGFISELHDGCNVFLMHYHYCTKPNNPFTMDWKNRQSTPFAQMSTDEIHFLIRTLSLVKEREDRIRVADEIGLYEDELYFVSQMFDENWTPKDTTMDFDEATVANVPLNRFYQPKK